jgi:hypothetical protein
MTSPTWAATPDPKGMGRIERAPNGEPAILRDAGIELPLPQPTFEQMRESIPATLQDFYFARGVTTVYDMSSPETAQEKFAFAVFERTGSFDDETCRLEPIDNPFTPKVLPMCSV